MNKELKIENGIIRSTFLGQEDHGILTSFLYIDFEGSSCGFGGYTFDSYNKRLEKRVGTAYGMKFIVRILETLEVENWESLKGKYVRVKIEGLGGKIKAIGNIVKNKWFDPEEEKNFLMELE